MREPRQMPDTSDWRKLYPFESHWLDLPGGRMHYLDERPASSRENPYGSTLLFVHGNPTWSFHWRRLVAAMHSRFRCVAPDNLGCGLSEKPTWLLSLDDHIGNLCALIGRLNLRNITLVAQDWGGAIGLGAMLLQPERLDRIVLFNTGAFTPRYIPWRIRACRIPVIGRLAVQGGNLFCRAALRMTLARRKSLEPAVAAGYVAPYDSWANRRAVYGFVRDIPRPKPSDALSTPGAEKTRYLENGAANSAQETWLQLADIERRLPTLADRPSLLVWGMRDWCFRPDCLERFIAAWPHAEVHRLYDVGHWVVEDAADESLTIVERFLEVTAGQVHHGGTETT